MNKIVAIVAAVIIVAGGGTAAYVVLHDSKTNDTKTANSQSADSMQNMDTMSQKSGSSGSQSSTGGQGADTDTGSTGNTSGNAAGAASTDQVKISNYAFTPATITVKVGTKVTWTNGDVVQHTVTKDGDDGPASPPLNKGDSYTYTFTKAGTYTYHCTPHPYMKGTVVVTE